MERYDAIVVGLGAMGSAAAYHLATRGRSVLGIDRHRPPHREGSSHGETRIIRQAYWEDPAYVPLVRRAYDLWADLEASAGRKGELLRPTGGVFMGYPDGDLVPGLRRSAEVHGIDIAEVAPAEVRRRWPALRPDDGMAAAVEPTAGALDPEACVRAHLDLAAKAGAVLRTDEAVEAWTADGDGGGGGDGGGEGGGVAVRTDQGTYHGRRLVLAAGGWLPALLGDLDLPLTIERQVQHWFAPPGAGGSGDGAERADGATGGTGFAAGDLPLFAFEDDDTVLFYGFPDLGRGVKVAIHHEGETVTGPDDVDRTVRPDDVRRMRALLAEFVPALDREPDRSRVCFYTNTPDHRFVVDRHPHHRHVLLASPCSGHGFKFSSAIGEALADLCDGDRPTVDLSHFALDRFL